MHEYKLIQMGLKSNRWDSCFSGAWLSQQRATFSGVKASSIHIAERNSQLYKEDRHAMHFQRFYSFQHYLLYIMKLKTFTQAQSIGMNATGLSISFFNNFWSYTLLKLQFIDQSVSKSH